MGDTPPTALAAAALFIAWAAAEGAVHRRGLFQPPRADGRRAGLTWLQTAYVGVFLVGWLDASALGWTTLPDGWTTLRWSGVAVITIGLVIRLVARETIAHNFSAFVQTCESHELVTHGVYRWVRHPAYTGFVGFLVGYPMAFGSLASLAIAVAIGAPSLAHRIRVEERSLELWFGERWRSYAARTARLFPGVW